ncbi:MAG: hypothetical protein ACK4UN_07925 [Limisphaerales bacterium]
MGFLSFFSRSEEAAPLSRLVSGSITVDAEGNVITSTLPRSFPQEKVEEISTRILKIFQGAKQAHLPLHELVLDYPALKITARELRGGAIIFLAPAATKVPKSGG